MKPLENKPSAFPIIQTAGVDGMLVSFDGTLSEPANRAALAFRAAVGAEAWDGITEISSSLVSVCVRFDPLHLPHAQLQTWLAALLNSRDWYQADLPEGRRLWRIPTVFGTDRAPQLAEAAELAGLNEAEAIRSLTETPVRVQTIGFAPGQPYLGELPEAWNIPRQSQLTQTIPQGALAVAIRQMVLFSAASPTGWRHVGQTAIQLFQPNAKDPFVLRPGDEVLFHSASPETLNTLRNDPMGGATKEPIT
ncbi:5-oxoprolinase subunit B family protein [Cognatishimia maritima]|uniref:Sensor histidine kinase inhibitor, KipI family n=1 Tax=Cognatishimia maritima TaxID=870908 RepID=A0A1M5W1J8_9RHOB|nr:allophanate hydrolase subunit 1 [Cognatishimia maritima]SHH81310.1 sensor histidine kinase inhibitor, KipI family [Cognatishimia maritima]